MSFIKKAKVAETVVEEKAVAIAKDIKAPKRLGRFIPNTISRKAGRASLKVAEKSPTILFVGGSIGVVGTVVLACRATLKVEGVLDEIQKDLLTAREVLGMNREDYTQTEFKRDMTIIYIRSGVKLAKLYGPAFVLGVTSLASLSGAHMILNRRNVGLTAAYTVLNQGFEEYRARVREDVGEDKEREYRYGVTEKTIVEPQESGEMKKVRIKQNAVQGRSIYARVFDQTTSRNWHNTPLGNRTFIQAQQNWCNDMLQSRGHLFLNEVYDLLGLERSPEGQVVGWILDGGGDDFVDFGLFNMSAEGVHRFMFDGEQSIVLDFNVDGPVYKKLAG